jgi:hypothetical protein
VVPVRDWATSPAAQTCTLGAGTWLPVWEVLEQGEVRVGATAVAVRHVRMSVNDDDEYPEHIVLDWYLDVHGLPVKAELTKQTLADTIAGDVTYSEQYTLQLVSLSALK